MKFYSNRSKTNPIFFYEAVRMGLAQDGGLFLPEKFPSFTKEDYSSLKSIQDVATLIFSSFLENDPIFSGKANILAEKALNFDIPLVYLKDETAVLELFHGPTASFKDVGARFLAECLNLIAEQHKEKHTILVATSGDTGGAVASAFNLSPNFDVIVLYPKGKVSYLQEKQLTCWGSNITSLAVNGDFDDCQRLVKSAFSHSWWKANKKLTSANSINIARILPQSVYYAAASLWYKNKTGAEAGFIIPSGNLGNGVAALWAKQMGFPIREVVFATNSNRPIADYFEGKEWKPQPTKITLANAMDVGSPSNIDRLFALYPSRDGLNKVASAISVTDDQIKETIEKGLSQWGQIWCPHTATAVYAREQLQSKHWIMVSTAHPAKFPEVVDYLIKQKLPVPNSLLELYSKASSFTEIEPNDDSFINCIKNKAQLK